MSTCCCRDSALMLTTIFIISLFTSQSLLAESATDNQRIVVTATRTAQIADETLAPVIVIDREQIDNTQAMDIADVLRFHAGLDIGRNGGPGQTTSVFLRGTDSNHTLVMIDGVKINPATIGGAALHNISPDIIERIEIVKGPRSTLYGSEAIGGVINIITRRGGEASFKAKVGSHNTQQISAETHHQTEKISSGVSVSMLDSDGFAINTGSTLDRGHNNTSLNIYVDTTISGHDIKISHWQTEGTTEYFDFFLTPLDQDFSNSSTALTLNQMPQDDWSSTLKFSHIIDEVNQNQSIDYAHTYRNTLDWQNDVQIRNQLLTAGIMLSQENADASSFGTAFDENTQVNAVYIQDDFISGIHHILVAARYTDHETFDQQTTWDIEYGIQLGNNSRLSAMVGTGFRAPDSSDRFGYGGNINLDAETSRNIELGYQHKLNSNQTLAIHAFDNQIDNLIAYFDPDDWFGPLPGVNQNIDKAHIRGVEASYQLQYDHWGMQLELINQQPENDATGELLPRRAERSLTASAYYSTNAWIFGMDLVASSKRKDSNFSTVMNPGYALSNINVSYHLTRESRITGKIENLLDKEYTLADGYNTAERAYFVELSYHPKQ